MRSILLLVFLLPAYLCNCQITESLSLDEGLEIGINDQGGYYLIVQEQQQDLVQDILTIESKTYKSLFASALDQRIELPLPQPILYTNIIQAPLENFVPIFYKVKPKETLYRISKEYFNQPIEVLIQRNQLPGFDLSVDQILLVGYAKRKDKYELVSIVSKQTEEVKKKELPKSVDNEEAEIPATKIIEETVIETQQVISSPSKVSETKGLQNEVDQKVTDSLETEKTTLTDSLDINKTKVRKKAIAIWKGSKLESGPLFVLHKTAAINSLMNITNPVTGLNSFARVVGRIPQNTYKNDVSIIMSTGLAHEIGALDQRMQVYVTYYE